MPHAAGISLAMLPVTTHGERGPLIVMLHWLGGSAATWAQVAEGLAARGATCAALDLPGFGRASTLPNHSIASMADAVTETLQQLRRDDRPWLLAGHSMGGKLAAILARSATLGHPGLSNLRGLLLVSPSPPGPEPMDEKTRRQLIDALGHPIGNAHTNRTRAEDFVDNNTGKLPLLQDTRARAVDDVLHAAPSAFVDWLTTGSQEDWSAHVGTLDIPALVLAGTEEPALGPDAQRQHTLTHLAEAMLVPLVGGGHLGPLERPAELVDRTALWMQQHLGLRLEGEATLSPEFRALIDSDRTSPQTRAVLKGRLAADASLPGILSADALTLRAVVARVLPGCSFDLATRAQRWLALPQHDGWRHDTLPPDAEAWRTGLHTLDHAALHRHHVPFLALHTAQQDELLTAARDGDLSPSLLDRVHIHTSETLFNAAQLAAWFGDLCGQLAMLYTADPRTMQRIGFTGFADDHGFTQIQLGEREDFEVEVK